MRAAQATVALLALAMACAGCGGGHRAQTTAGSPAAARRTPAPESAAELARSTAGSFGNDEDDDDFEPGVPEGYNKKDTDADYDNDFRRNRPFFDHDDRSMATFGHAAVGAQGRALRGLAERYYAAAAAGNGSAACAMLTAAFARLVPEQYGGSAAPAYMRGASTCAGVMGLLFAHLRLQLQARVTIVAARVKGREAYVFLKTRYIPASYLVEQREAGGWRVIGPLASPMT
jgi:hypothetical protein